MNFSLGAPEILLGSLVLCVIIALFDIQRSASKSSLEKLVWSCVVIFFPFIGVIIYLSVGRKERFLYDVLKKFYDPN